MIHNRLIGCSTEIEPHTNDYYVDVGGILRRGLLFETYTIKSLRLKEIPPLVKYFGVHGTIKLLKSNCIKLYLDSSTTAQTGQALILEKRAKLGALPLGSYCFQTMIAADRKDYISRCFKENIDPIKAPIKELKKLKQTILESLLNPEQEINIQSQSQLTKDLHSHDPITKTAIIKRIKEEYKIIVPTKDLHINIVPIDDEDYMIETNIKEHLKLNQETAHKLVERAILDVAGYNRRIAEMRAFNSLSGFREEDLPLFESKFDFFKETLYPDLQEDRARRVFRTADLPDFSDIEYGYKVDIDKFIEAQKSDDCRAFRDWLRNIDHTSDKEILEATAALKARISTFSNSKSGRALRFLTTNSIGLIPGAGLLSGATISALEVFLFEKVFKKSPIATFIGRTYPKLFSE